MNILPKKSWHVRNKDNIERVRRDEAQAAAEEKERQRRIALAESEARLSLLRGKSHKSIVDSDAGSSGGHVNLFTGIDGETDDKKNKEHEEEQRLAKEEWERKVGILTYLGQSATESQQDKPWYHKPAKRRKDGDDDASTSAKLQKEMDLKTKSSLDPMKQMSKYLEVKRKQEERSKGDKVKEKHKHKHHRKKHKYDKEKAEEQKPSGGAKTVEMLRAERLERERQERLQTEQLLARHRGEKVPGEKEGHVTDERQMRFNSQFNPEFVRTKRRYQDDFH